MYNKLTALGLCLLAEFLKGLKWMLSMKEMLRQSVKIIPLRLHENMRPFRALLDVGLIRTTTGNRVFRALKLMPGCRLQSFFSSEELDGITGQVQYSSITGAKRHILGQKKLISLSSKKLEQQRT